MTRPRDALRRRTLLALAGGATASVAAAGVTAWLGARSSVGEGAQGPALPGFAARAGAIARIEVRTDRETFTLTRGPDDAWTMPERGGFPVATDPLQRLARGLASLRLTGVRSAERALHARLGVADPPARGGTRLRLSDEAGTLVGDVTLGPAFGPDGLERHVRRGAEPLVYVAEGGLPPLGDPTAFLDLARIDVSPERIASVAVTLAEGGGYEIVRRPDGGFAPVGGLASPNATAAALALTQWRPVDVRPAGTMREPPAAVHETVLRNGMVIRARAYPASDDRAAGGHVVVTAQALDPTSPAAGEARALEAQVSRWAFALVPADFADFMLPAAAVLGR
jgi:Domain of unknown function (DUF4340)